MKRFYILLFLVSASFSVSAQLGDSIKAHMISEWERAKIYTKEYMDAVPKDKFDFRAQDSVRSFGQQMLHLAQANILLSTSGTGKAPLWQGVSLENSKTAQSADSVIFYTMASYDFVIDGIKQLSPEKFLERTGRGKFMFPRYLWILKAFEHQTHHRGQTTIYIRLMGIRPPLYKK